MFDFSALSELGDAGEYPQDHDDPSPVSETASEPSWRCWSCGNDTFAWTGEGWKCASCRSGDYYNAVVSQRRETDNGVWMYVPRQSQSHGSGSDPPPLDPLPDTTSQAFDHNRTRVGHASPHEGPFHESREQAESEAPRRGAAADPGKEPRIEL